MQNWSWGKKRPAGSVLVEADVVQSGNVDWQAATLMNDECDIAMLVSVNDIFPASLAPNSYRMLARVQGFF